MLNTILFDLDGTLLPFIEKEFIHSYFERLTNCVVPLGYEKENFIKVLWAGTMDMIANTGEKSNRDAFWEKFCALLGADAMQLETVIDEFYGNDFDRVREVLRESRDCAPLIRSLKDKGYTLVLATNPIFPTVAVHTRLGWVGLQSEAFDHITTYENSCFAKPNPEYYRAILRQIHKQPEECVMLGNNPSDDGSAEQAGIKSILITDYLQNDNNLPLTQEQMCFTEMVQWLESLPALK